jgi:hypothetical protein
MELNFDLSKSLIVPLLLLAFCIATFSCKNDEDRKAVQVEAIPVDPATTKEMLIFDLFQSVDFIPITSDSLILVHEIAKVRELGDYDRDYDGSGTVACQWER